MTAPLPGGRRRSIVRLATAIDRGLVQAPAPSIAAPPVLTVVAPAAPQPESEKRRGGRPKLAGDPAYRRAKPFPHAVIEDFLPAELAEDAYLAFPNADDPIWRDHGREFTGDGHSKKLECAKVEAMPEALRKVFDLLTGPTALEKLKALTGFDDLFADPSLYGGGITLTPPGGFLRPHADFNFADHLKAYRVVNLIVWLNSGWKRGDGGELQLYRLGQVEKSIEPTFNRAAVFTCSKDAVHGYGEVTAPRRSLSVYFYRYKAPLGFDGTPHRTIWHD